MFGILRQDCDLMRPISHVLQVAAGKSACIFDQTTCQPMRRYNSGAVREMLHSPRVEGTRDGRLLFIGNADGALQAFDLRCSYASSKHLKFMSCYPILQPWDV